MGPTPGAMVGHVARSEVAIGYLHIPPLAEALVGEVERLPVVERRAFVRASQAALVLVVGELITRHVLSNLDDRQLFELVLLFGLFLLGARRWES